MVSFKTEGVRGVDEIIYAVAEYLPCKELLLDS
jgi:hypothetical protein